MFHEIKSDSDRKRVCGRKACVKYVCACVSPGGCSATSCLSEDDARAKLCFSCFQRQSLPGLEPVCVEPSLWMRLQMWTSGLLLLFISAFHPAEAMMMYDPQLCYILDGFLALYGLVITGMFIKEKFFRAKVKAAEDSVYTDLRGQDSGGYAPLRLGDPERGRNRRTGEDIYTDLNKRTDGEYKELPMKRERHKKNEQVYQGLSKASRDTYDSLQMQPLPAR
ncbi:protein CREG1 isoform X2 [Genypterus blacodes]|uniref:protein CREG1 isoform X2 n=1 Tax=Genypterus blacodes TaxID=154954 RepID=UPI003F770378